MTGVPPTLPNRGAAVAVPGGLREIAAYPLAC